MKKLISLLLLLSFTIKAQDVTIIGTQTWTTKNADVTAYFNGFEIEEVKDKEEWELAGPAWCYYNNDPANDTKYGKLYNWYAVSSPAIFAPNGFHIPTKKDWMILINYLGGDKVAGKKMKSSTGWSYDGNGTDSSGFAALPGGYRGKDGSFSDIGAYGYFWCEDTVISLLGLLRLSPRVINLSYNSKYGGIYWPKSFENYGYSVRFIKDGPLWEIDDAEAYLNSGIAKINLKDYTGSIADYSKAIQLNPDYSLAYHNRGVAKYYLEDYTGSIADYSKAIQLKPDDAEAYTNRGIAKSDLKDYTGAIADYNKAIQLKPDDADAFLCRGSAKINLKDYTGAIADYNKAIQLNPDDAIAYYGRGIAKSDLKDYTGAIADYNKAIQLKPDDADAYNNRGNAKSDLKDLIGACKDWSKAGELGCSDAYTNIKNFCQ